MLGMKIDGSLDSNTLKYYQINFDIIFSPLNELLSQDLFL